MAYGQYGYGAYGHGSSDAPATPDAATAPASPHIKALQDAIRRIVQSSSKPDPQDNLPLEGPAIGHLSET